MNRLFMLSDDIISRIFDYYNPYIHAYQEVLHDINWWGFWYRYVTKIFYRRNFVFHRYILNQINEEDSDDNSSD